MPHPDLYLSISTVSLMMPLAGIGRSLRPEAARRPRVIEPTAPIPPRRRGRLALCWRKDSAGMLVMQWRAQ
jgi:hypothetical protein